MKKITFILGLFFTFIFTSCENHMDEISQPKTPEISTRAQSKEIFKGNPAMVGLELTLYYNNSNWNYTYAIDRYDAITSNFTVTTPGIINFDYTINGATINFSSPGIGYSVRTYGAKLINASTGAIVASLSSVIPGKVYSLNVPSAGTYRIGIDTEMQIVLQDATIKEAKMLHISYRYDVDAIFVY